MLAVVEYWFPTLIMRPPTPHTSLSSWFLMWFLIKLGGDYYIVITKYN